MGFGDLGKKSVLKRTKIEYSEAEPLVRKLASYPITIDLLEDLFEINDRLLHDNDFIKKIEKQFPKDNELLERIFLNYLSAKGGALPKITSKRRFSTLCNAYISFNQSLIEENRSLDLPKKLMSLYIFGQYKAVSIDNRSLGSKDIFTERLKVISQCGKYVSIPSMIDKKQTFSAFASYDNANRVYNTIINSGGTDDDQICLLYWGLVFLALLNKDVHPLMREYFLTLSDKTLSLIHI